MKSSQCFLGDRRRKCLSGWDSNYNNNKILHQSIGIDDSDAFMNSMGLIFGLSVRMKVSCVHPPTIRKCSCSGLWQEIRGKEEWRASPRSTNILRCYFKLFYIRSWGSTGNYLFIFLKKHAIKGPLSLPNTKSSCTHASADIYVCTCVRSSWSAPT